MKPSSGSKTAMLGSGMPGVGLDHWPIQHFQHVGYVLLNQPQRCIAHDHKLAMIPIPVGAKNFSPLHSCKSAHGKPGKPGSPILRTEVKRQCSPGLEKTGFLASDKTNANALDFFAFSLYRTINGSMSTYPAAPVTHQDLDRRSSPTALRRPDSFRSHSMSKCLFANLMVVPTRCWLMEWSTKCKVPKCWRPWLPIKSGGYTNPYAGSPLPPNLCKAFCVIKMNPVTHNEIRSSRKLMRQSTVSDHSVRSGQLSIVP